MTYATSTRRDDIGRRIRAEAAIGKCLVKSLLEAGFALADGSADDDAQEAKPKTSYAATMKWLGECDEDRILVYAKKTDLQPTGWVHLVYGNDGWDAICDYTINLEKHMKKVNALAHKLDPDNLRD